MKNFLKRPFLILFLWLKFRINMARTDTTPDIFFHVGLPKTASTFLQRNVFPVFKGIQFVKKHDFKHHDRIIATTKQPVVLLSIELDLDSKNGAKKMKTIATKYPEAKPIVVFRKHGSWVGSKYKYYLRKHGKASFEDYFDPDSTNGVLNNKHLLFYEKIKLLEEQYGSRPLVMFQEEFKNKPWEAIEAIAQFIGATYDKEDIKISTVKKSYSEHSLYYVRRLNRWYNYDHSGIKNKTLRFLYKKFSGGILHLVAYYKAITEPEKAKAKKVLPKAAVQKINEEYADDWKKCIEYASKDREVYL